MVSPTASAEKAYAAEHGIAGIRALIIVFNSVVYHALVPKAGTVVWLAYGIIVTANVYGFGVLALRPYRRFPVMLSSYFTTGMDAAFITVWLFATGGVLSPFEPLWFASLAAVAFRYGSRETVVAAVAYAASNTALALATGQLGAHAMTVLVQAAYIGFVAAIGALLAHESFAQTREKVELRVLADALRESELRVRRLADAAFEGIAIHDNGKVVECNEAFGRLFGIAPSDALGRTAFDFVAPEEHATVRDRLAVKRDEPFETIGVRADGSRFPIEIVARDFPADGRMLRVAAIRDLTERKRAEVAIHEQRRLAEMDRMRTQFINNAAHELATPLTPIKLQSHLLSVGSLGPLNEKQQKAVGVVSRNVEQLRLLVSDVLDSARIQGGHMRLHKARVAMGQLVVEAAESFVEAARASGVQLDVRVVRDAEVMGDRARLTQVLFNLVNNALKFTPRGGALEVEADALDGHAVVRVRDTGVGLRSEDVGKLFHPFSQAHPELAARGTGLGLYISRGIVESHGGRIWAESGGPGRGSTFSFSLPVER